MSTKKRIGVKMQMGKSLQEQAWSGSGTARKEMHRKAMKEFSAESALEFLSHSTISSSTSKDSQLTNGTE